MPPTEESVNPPPKRRGTLLIVDDEDGPRQSLRVIFKDEYDLLMAEDGPTAIELAKQHDIDVAVLDIRMAGMSGIEVLERLKYVKPDIEAIMMTAFETTDTIRKALQLRACDYINKPFDLATMRAAVSQAMQRRTLEGEFQSSAEKVQQLLADLENQRDRGTDRQETRRHLGEHHSRHQRPAHGDRRFSGFVEPAGQPHREGGGWKTWNSSRTRLNIIIRQTTNCIEISRRYLDILREKPGQSAPRVNVRTAAQRPGTAGAGASQPP